MSISLFFAQKVWISTKIVHVWTTGDSTSCRNTFQNISWHCRECCFTCIKEYMISKTNDWHGISETIITIFTCMWHFLCNKMNSAEEPRYWIVARYVWKKRVLWYLSQRTFQFQSHSQHLWLQSSPSHIMNLQYFTSSGYSIFNIIFSLCGWPW